MRENQKNNFFQLQKNALGTILFLILNKPVWNFSRIQLLREVKAITPASKF